MAITRKELEFKARAKIELNKRLYRKRCQDDFAFFVQQAWPSIEPAQPLMWGRAMDLMCEHLEAVRDHRITRLIINCPPGMSKSTLMAVMFPAWIFTTEPTAKILSVAHNLDLALRDSVRCRRLIQGEWYQDLWPQIQLAGDQNAKAKFEIEGYGGFRQALAAGAITGVRADHVVCDDLLSATDAMSEAIRNSMKDWVLEALPTRLNNPGGEKASTISLIQQRLHEEDSTGVLLEKNLGYEHLMLPMEYDPGRHCVTSVGEDWRTEDGELLFPERFPREVVDRDKQAMGPYACNTGEAPILMGDLSLKRIDEVSVGDEIMGWSKKEGGRTRIHRTTVEEVYKYRAKVVKITLDSGEVIRCTPDHKWWTQRYEKNRAEYIAANVGTPLARVCPSNIPHLTLEESRMAGWLAGFFDGEGSVSVCAKDGKGKYNPSYQIHFYQTAEQNLPICEKLEQALNMFKFDYTMNETPSRQNKIGASGRVGQKSRTYTLVNKQHSLGVAQKFINIVKPVKWVDRIQAMAEGSKFVKQWEKVISIEPDGEDDVYALTTGTGNYVVWGLASSNSASQFQQSPSPRGGGLIRRDQFMLYDDELAREQGKPDAGKYPDLDIIIASVDTAYTTKQENDASAITVWGIWQKGGASARSIISSYADNSNVFDMNGKRIQMVDERDTIPCAMLMYAKELRVPLHGDEVARLEGESPEAYRRRSESKWGLCEHLTDICKRFNVDTVLIEAKASGISVAQEMKRLNKLASWTVKLCNPGNLDKVARVYSIQPIFSNGQVYAPEKDWADKVISQCEVFPRGKHDDLVDTVSQALRYLRDNNFLARADEVGARVADEYNLAGSKRKQWIYDV